MKYTIDTHTHTLVSGHAYITQLMRWQLTQQV